MPCNNPVDREGTFRAKIREYALFEAESGALAINVVADLTDMWNGSFWEGWSEYGQDVEGAVWIRKKDGTANEKAISSLCQHAEWRGTLREIDDRTWEPTPCQVVVKFDDYNTPGRYRVSFINGFNDTPGGTGNVSSEKVRALEDSFGAQLRAIAGNAKLNAPKRNGQSKPPAPKPRAKAAASGRPVDGAGREHTEDDIPFDA